MEGVRKMNAIQFLKEKITNHTKFPVKNHEVNGAEVIEDLEVESSLELNGKEISATDSEDHLTTNLMSTVFSIIEERRKLLMLVKDYKDKLAHSQAIFADVLKEKNFLEGVLKEREDELLVLQKQIEAEQQKYEDLMEDHKALRVNELNERLKLQQRIKELQADYDALSEECRKIQEEKDREALANKEKIRKELERYNHLQLKFNELSEENKVLMDKLTSFAKQISALNLLNPFLLPDREDADLNKGN
jgi:chromosome segregation ATPase